MEYFIGSIATLAVVITLSILIKRFYPVEDHGVAQSQSYIHNLVDPYMLSNEELKKPVTSQATKHFNKLFIRIVFVDDKAYWIKEDVFYVADTFAGVVLKDTAQPVDTMSMDRVQLNKMMLIVEKLREGAYDDSWNAGES